VRNYGSLLAEFSGITPGVYTLDGMLKYGEKHTQCPHFTAGGNGLSVEPDWPSSVLTDCLRCHFTMSQSTHTFTCWIPRLPGGFPESFPKTV